MCCSVANVFSISNRTNCCIQGNEQTNCYPYPFSITIDFTIKQRVCKHFQMQWRQGRLPSMACGMNNIIVSYIHS